MPSPSRLLPRGTLPLHAAGGEARLHLAGAASRASRLLVLASGFWRCGRGQRTSVLATRVPAPRVSQHLAIRRRNRALFGSAPRGAHVGRTDTDGPIQWAWRRRRARLTLDRLSCSSAGTYFRLMGDSRPSCVMRHGRNETPRGNVCVTPRASRVSTVRFCACPEGVQSCLFPA